MTSKRAIAAITALLAVIVCSAAWAQPGKIKFDRLSIDQGLSQASGNAIRQDAQGFLWIGTQDGLSRWDGYQFEVFKRDPDNEASLTDNFVARIEEDSRGRFWLYHQTQGAITVLEPARRTFRRVAHDLAGSHCSSATAPFFTFRSFFEHDDGQIWIGTNGGGILRVDPDTLEAEHLCHDPDDPESLGDDDVEMIVRTTDGTLWIGGEGFLQRRLPPADGRERFFTFRHDPEDPTSLPPGEIDNIVEEVSDGSDGAGPALWVGGDQGLARFSPRDGSPQDGSPQDGTFTRFLEGDDYPPLTDDDTGGDPFAVPLFFDRRGELWVGVRPGFAIFDPQTGRFRHHRSDAASPGSFPSRFVQAFEEDQAGDLWFGTGGGGVARYVPEKDNFETYRHDASDPHSLVNDVILSIYESRGGILWIGTFGGGISSYSRSKHKFTHVTREPSGLADDTIFSILVDSEGSLWVGTQVGGLHRYDKDRQRVVERYFLDPGGPRNIGSDFVPVIYEDRDERFWVGSRGGLALIDRDRGRVAKRYLNDPGDDNSLSSDNVVDIYEDREGTFWVGTGNGIDILDRATGRFERIEHDPARPDRSLPQAGIWQIKEDRLGRMWIGTTVGLCRLERDTHEVTCYRHDPGNPASLSQDNVMDFWTADDGTFWIATYGGGLNHFDPETETFTHLTMRDGLPNDSLYSVLPDSDGYLWLSCNRGLTRFDPRTREMRIFDAEDGLQSNEFNSRAFFASDDGELFFGGLEGFNVFRPEDVEESSYLPPVTLTAFSTLGRRGRTLDNLEGLEEVTVRHRDHVFSFEFASLDYTSPERNRYAYKLEGFDEGWIPSGSRRFASYTNLDGGTYTFRVRGTNSDGVWNDDGASIRVVVIPPPWKTWWAYSLYVLAALGTTLGYVRYKTLAHRHEVERHRREAERLKAIDRMKDEFLANTSHELRTPLNGIIGISESLLDGAGGEIPSAARDNLIMVSASGRRLAHLVDDILDFSKLKNHEIALRKRPVALRELVEVTLMLCRPLVGSRQLELANEVAADLPAVEADEDRLQQILHNLLGNAIKFTREGRVAVSAGLNGSESSNGHSTVKVTVADTGIGIPADKLDRIFESFQQADASSAREFGGTGLGLTITRQLVQLHGGSMGVTSTEGEGSRFSFTLPVADPESSDQGLGATSTSSQKLSRIRDVEPAVSTLSSGPVSSSPGSEVTDLGGLRIAGNGTNGNGHVLCVDDEPINLQVLENLLGLEGYSIQRANDGLECLEILKRGDVPDLILLDVMMPRMTGFEVARRIRQEFSAHRLPILLVTAKNQVSDLVEGLSSGANDYLSKPFSKQELLARVRTHLNLSRAHSVEAENQRKTEEMKQARKIQLSLLPKEPPEIPHLEIATYLETATEVGGDYYDFFPQADGALYVVTGDATGHGISAGMMVSMTKSALKALDVQSPHILLQQLNSVVRAVDLTRMQMALNVAYITEDEVAISSAAMPPAFLYRAGRQVSEEVLVPGLPLGALPGTEYELRVFDLLPGDALVLLSDGLPELIERRGGTDGYAAVARVVEQHGAGSAQELLDALVALGDGGGNGSPEGADLLDDVTMVVVKKR